MVIEPYQQSLSHSCLVACFLMLLAEKRNASLNTSVEQDIYLKGSQRSHALYVTGIPIEIAQAFDVRVEVIADNKYFTTILRQEFPSNRFDVQREKITISLVREMIKQGPIICHIDDHFLGDYSHVSHFIVLEKCTEKSIGIVDPYTGKRRFIKDAQLNDAIQSLKSHIRMCPLLFRIAG